MRATELAAMLGKRADAMCAHLLPNGRRDGCEWRVGSAGGEAGKSLGVHLTGEKAGVWSDFSTGQSGDAIGLWMAVRGLSVRDACTEAANWLGVRQDRLDPPRRTFKKPSTQGVKAVSEAHRAWLSGKRKIPDATIAAYKLRTRDGDLMFPYLRDDELVMAKYRIKPELGKKKHRQDAGCMPILFGWQAISDELRSIVITEGEFDAMAWHAYGIPALSVPMGGGGGGKQNWIENEFDRLAVFDRIWVCMDDDEQGWMAENEIIDRLGRERCFIVRLPHKDANECLIQGVSQEDMLACLREARTKDPSELKRVTDFEDEIWAEYSRVDDGIPMPWDKMDDLKLREGEVSVWFGMNGHGKSTVVSQIVGVSAARGHKACVASLEYLPAQWLQIMNRQLAGVRQPTEEFCRHITRTMCETMFVFDVQGAAKAKRILEVFKYARKRYGVTLFLLDNLSTCGFADDDYPGQKLYIEQLVDFARSEQVHVMVVGHVRKGDDENKPAGKMGMKGSGGITDIASTVVEVWRNKPRERAINKARASGDAVPADKENMPTNMLICCKQRKNGKEPTYGLWFDEVSTQMLGWKNHRARPYVQFSALEAKA